MRNLPLFLLALSLLINPMSCATPNTFLSRGSSISVEKPEDILQSANGLFSSGFHRIGENAYAFAIWFTSPSCPGNCTVVWMANRDFPVNGRRSVIFLTKTGNLILTDASKFVAWSTNTNSKSITELRLEDSGNLVLKNIGEEATILWQSFDYPTDTLLPSQELTRETQLVSSRSPTNVSSGFYKLRFYANILSLVYDGPDVSSIYWPDPSKLDWDNGRQTYNNSRTASLDFLGEFSSSDHFSIASIDYGREFHRRLTLDYDGNLRIYSRDEASQEWTITGKIMWHMCKVHGICGENSTCFYRPESSRRCTCLPGYKMINPNDWSFGCEPEFSLGCPHENDADFLRIPHQGFYGYEMSINLSTNLLECKNICLNSCSCKGFVHKFEDGVLKCFPKFQLLNGKHIPNFNGDFYEKIPKGSVSLPYGIWEGTGSGLRCPERGILNVPLNRTYLKSHGSKTMRLLLIVASILMGVEVTGILLICLYLAIMSYKSSSFLSQQGYLQLPRFQKFTYSELAKATRKFKDEVGRGAAGIVYRGRLSDGRVAAIKKLYGANHGEAEFLAEITTIGTLNHMNLIEMWGYCAEGQHRILVYEYMEHGSLAQNLSSKSLNWERRFNIALGTARGLAYLHEECLEWVLHCDVKPQNILLDADYQPKVSDFGMSKLLNRNDSDNPTFSRIRGTRGYMAPEWVSNLPITSKVDVYSYGVVMLELVTGKVRDGGAEAEHESVVTRARNKVEGLGDGSSWIKEMMDPTVEGEYDMAKMEALVSMALQCVEDDIYERPTMGKVVEMLLH